MILDVMRGGGYFEGSATSARLASAACSLEALRSIMIASTSLAGSSTCAHGTSRASVSTNIICKV